MEILKKVNNSPSEIRELISELNNGLDIAYQKNPQRYPFILKIEEGCKLNTRNDNDFDNSYDPGPPWPGEWDNSSR